MNKVQLVGRTTREPEVRYSQSATPVAVARLGIAVKNPRSKEQKADFFNLVAFGKTAEIIEKYCPKGTLISVTGRLQINQWEDDKKVKHNSCDIVIEEIEFLARAKGTAATPGEIVPNSPIQFEEDDDLPF